MTAEYPPDQALSSLTRTLAENGGFEKKKSCFRRFTNRVGRLVASCKAKCKQSLNEKHLPSAESQEALINWQPEREGLTYPTPSSTGSWLNDTVDDIVVETPFCYNGPARVGQCLDGASIKSNQASVVGAAQECRGIIPDAEFWALPTYSDTSSSRGVDEDDCAVSSDHKEDYSDWNILLRAKIQARILRSQLECDNSDVEPIDQSLFADFDCSNVVTDPEGSEYFASWNSRWLTDWSFTDPGRYAGSTGMLYYLEPSKHSRNDFHPARHRTDKVGVNFHVERGFTILAQV